MNLIPGNRYTEPSDARMRKKEKKYKNTKENDGGD